MSRTVITLSREYGSGGRIIAQRLAKRLGVPFYDKEIITLAARESGLSPEFIERTEQQKTSSLLYGVFAGSHSLPMGDQIFIAQSNVIKKLAGEGPCVIVGRCSDYVLKDHPGLLRVFIHAPLEERIARAVSEYGICADEAAGVVQKTDKSRASYYTHFTSGKWGLCQNFDVALNSGLGMDVVENLLYDLIK